MTDTSPPPATPPLPDGLALGGAELGEVSLAWLTDPAADPSAPLALCLHGFPDSPHTWSRLMPELTAAGFRPVAPWMRGYHPSAVPDDGLYQIGALARDVVRLHETLGGDERAVIIGHDWGAMTTYAAVGWRPELFRRAVTLNVPPTAALMGSFTSYDQLRRSWYMFFFQSPLAEMVVAAEDLAFIERLWRDWSPGHDAPAHVEAAKAALRDPANLAAALGCYRAMLGDGKKDDALADADAAWMVPPSIPTLYLHGADDGCLGVELVEGAAAHLPAPGSRVEVVDGAGHFLAVEAPERVNPLIVSFLTEES